MVRPALPILLLALTTPLFCATERVDSAGIIAEADMVAYYGHPNNHYLGILGEAELETTAQRLRLLADEYDLVNGERAVLPTFHLIYAIAHPDGSVGTMEHEAVMRYIRFGLRHGFHVILDHQIGSGDVVPAVVSMLPYLRFDNVHLAIDPEWATERPGKVIGTVQAADVNRAQRAMQLFMERYRLPERRMLVVHQFNPVMIANLAELRHDIPQVDLIHNADGFGPPKDKYKTWREVLTVGNTIPLKGIKLFYRKPWRSWGHDEPLMTPDEVLALQPRPVLFIYQ